VAIRAVHTRDVRASELTALRAVCDAAFSADPEAFTDDDWDHALGGVHFVAEEDDEIVAHASVIERELHVGDVRLSTGYVEAVATSPPHQRRGYGSAVMREVGAYIDRTFPLGALDTGIPSFYERLGWVVWKGPTYVRAGTTLVRTAEDDGNVLVRITPSSPDLDLNAPISCEWRPGDVW
jgi:aminoglycoside 2'-N-acetyltransferase I